MLYAIVAVLVLIGDQWLKYWVTANIVLDTGSLDLIPGVLQLVNIHNDGAAFSLLSGAGARWFFVALGIAVAVVVVVALARNMIRGAFGRWCAVLAAAGALGNVIDRAMFGYVVDMFMVPPVRILQIFNVADIFITVGGILFCIYIIFGGRDGEEKKKAKAGVSDEAAEAEPFEAEKPAPAPAVKKAEKKQEKKPEIKAEKKPEPAPAPKKAPPVPEKDAMDFSIDDIMDEFK